MERWKLSFASQTDKYQLPKIFFGFRNDTLYFGYSFQSLERFEAEVDNADRRALRNVAVNPEGQFRKIIIGQATT
jgi:hypothetical protein